MNFDIRSVLLVLGTVAIGVALATAQVTTPPPSSGSAVQNIFKLKTGKQVERVGSQLFLLDEAGKKTLAKDGTYPLTDGRQFVVRNGKIASFGPLSKAAPQGGGATKSDLPSDQTTLKNAQTVEVDKVTTTVPSAGNRPGITQQNPVKGKVLTPPASP